ncbi:C2 and GRAM domain-containing protein [Acorus calamus]|uniref:C2 and GRAM domain-containing protein n=1 Tax=Acorus calamus TaxID=4465 RepID=A0AAV9F2N9_ACOCL|nr:C2 and GRAM domain-containing protein [Acorus calamus]
MRLYVCVFEAKDLPLEGSRVGTFAKLHLGRHKSRSHVAACGGGGGRSVVWNEEFVFRVDVDALEEEERSWRWRSYATMGAEEEGRWLGGLGFRCGRRWRRRTGRCCPLGFRFKLMVRMMDSKGPRAVDVMQSCLANYAGQVP